MKSRRDCDLAAVMEAAYGPRWQRGPALDETDVAKFEEFHDVRLPDEYRSFVVRCANGAAGPPTYGLVALGDSADASSVHRVMRGHLGRPFPLKDTWVWEGSDLSGTDQLRIQLVHSQGTLPLGTDGDGMDYVLVVTGEARGQVWMLTGEGAIPVARDFTAWLRGDVYAGAEWLLDNRNR